MPKATQTRTLKQFGNDVKKSSVLQKAIMIAIMKESERLDRLQLLVLSLAIVAFFTTLMLYITIFSV